MKDKKEVYWYEFTDRPLSPNCQPKGFVDYVESKGKHGIVAYERSLTIDELYEFEMKPYDEKEKSHLKSKVKQKQGIER